MKGFDDYLDNYGNPATWGDGRMTPDEIMAAMCDLFPSPEFDDIRRRISLLADYGYEGGAEALEALDPADRAAIAGK